MPRRPRLNRTPSQQAEGLISGVSRSFGEYRVGITLTTSQRIVDLLYTGPRASGMIAAVNQVHREMAATVVFYADQEYRKARKDRFNPRRDARRAPFAFEREMRAMQGLAPIGTGRAGKGPGRSHPVFKSATGASGIRAGSGFRVDFTELDSLVTNDGFPYWRSLEFGYSSFLARRPLFSSRKDASGGFSPPSGFPLTWNDPRMPQNMALAPFETVKIRGFKGYGMFGKAIRKVSSGDRSFKRQGSVNYYPDLLLRQGAIPDEWVEALNLISAGATIGRSGGRGPRRILFQTDPRF